jgi:hypothetical protein
MNRADFITSIRRSWDLVIRTDLGLSFSVPVPLPVNPEFRDLLYESGSAYEDVYVLALRRSHYNFILSDFSFFQFSFFESDRSTRMAFFPNPFQLLDFSPEELEILVSEGAISYEDYASLSGEARILHRAPPIRYEYAPGQYREIIHPSSHFHIGHHSENRWSIERMLTPLAFTMWIIKQYYSTEWAMFADAGDKLLNKLNTELEAERQKCPPLPQELFSDRERSLFYFT